jgi:hypothetical protein
VSLAAEPPADPADIAFEDLDPAGNVSITQGQSVGFSYALSNPDTIATASGWYRNGTLVAANQSSYTAGGLVAGDYAMAVMVWSAENTLSHTWHVTVAAPANSSDGVGTVGASSAGASSAGGGGGGGGGGAVPSVERPSTVGIDASGSSQSGSAPPSQAPPTPEEQMTMTVQDYFTGGSTTRDLIDALKEYYGVR